MADLSGHTILVVDDNDAGREVKSRLLRHSGYRIIEAANGGQTLALVRAEKPALVVLDVMLPDIDGLELCQRIKGDPETAPIMVLQTSSARISTENRLAGLETGADAYLTEPIEPSELTTTVKVLLRLYDREEQNRRLLAELRTREAEFRASFENTSFGMAQAEPFTGKLLRVNRRFCEILGYQEAELLGRSFIEFTHADDRTATSADFTRLLKGEITEYRAEKRQVKKDGSFIWSEVTLNLVRDAAGQPLRMVGVIQDISARKRMEEIAQRWQRLFEESFFGLAHEDARTNSFVAVNRAFAEHRGYTVEELSGKPALTIYPADLQDQVSQSIRGADENGHALFETVHQRKDGTTFPVLLEVMSIKDRAGQAHSRMAYALDISRLKTAEAALRQSEEQFRAFFESAVVGTVVCDPATGRFLKVNEAFCRMIGYSAEELSRLTPYQLTYPDDLDNLRQVVGRWHRGESESLQIDKRYQRKDGSPLWVRVNANMVRDGAGRALMGVAIIADISERKRIQLNSEFLLKLGRELGQLTDADAIGNTGVRAIAQYLKVAGCCLLTVDFASGRAEVNYQWFSDQRRLAPSYPIDEFAAEDLLEIMRRGEAVALDDVDGDPRTRPHAANFAAHGIRAFAAAPYLGEGVFEAVLTVSAAAPRSWSSDEVRCLQNVIARVWPAIKRARVVAELREREASLSASNQDLVRFNRAAVGRELRMIELKREINTLCAAAGQPPRYKLEADPVAAAATGAESSS